MRIDQKSLYGILDRVICAACRTQRNLGEPDMEALLGPGRLFLLRSPFDTSKEAINYKFDYSL